jgi:hypothetical protein
MDLIRFSIRKPVTVLDEVPSSPENVEKPVIHATGSAISR